MTSVQKFTYAFGAVYVFIGFAGFLPFLGGTVGMDVTNLLGLFGITAVHNVVHLLIGFLFLAAAQNHSSSVSASITIGAVYLVVAIIGAFNIDFIRDLLGLNLADNVLHLLSGVVALGVGLSNRPAAAA